VEWWQKAEAMILACVTGSDFLPTPLRNPEAGIVWCEGMGHRNEQAKDPTDVDDALFVTCFNLSGSFEISRNC